MGPITYSDDTSEHCTVVYTLTGSPGEALGVYIVGRGSKVTVLLILEQMSFIYISEPWPSTCKISCNVSCNVECSTNYNIFYSLVIVLSG